MKILIVGGTSSVSKALIPVLSISNEVITAGRNGCDLHIDLNEPSSTYNIPEDIDVLIHTAAHFGGKSDTEILKAEEINVLGTLKLCKAAVRANVKHFILISTIFTTLNEIYEQNTIYALSKRHADEVASYYCKLNSMPLTILKPSQLYGNEEVYRKHQPFFYTLIDKAQNGDHIIIYGSHDPLRNFLHIKDLTEIICKVIIKGVVGIYSCANPTDVSFTQIATAAFKAFNRNANIIFQNEKDDISDSIFEKDNNLYEKIDFYPQITIEDGMKAIANYRK